MTIDDIEIKIKKYDREKEHVILNLIICKKLEIRGYTAKLLETKTEPRHSFWSVSPPCKERKDHTYFWIVEVPELDFWTQIKEKIIDKVKNYPENI